MARKLVNFRVNPEVLRAFDRAVGPGQRTAALTDFMAKVAADRAADRTSAVRPAAKASPLVHRHHKPGCRCLSCMG